MSKISKRNISSFGEINKLEIGYSFTFYDYRGVLQPVISERLTLAHIYNSKHLHGDALEMLITEYNNRVENVSDK